MVKHKDISLYHICKYYRTTVLLHPWFKWYLKFSGKLAILLPHSYKDNILDIEIDLDFAVHQKEILKDNEYQRKRGNYVQTLNET